MILSAFQPGALVIISSYSMNLNAGEEIPNRCSKKPIIGHCPNQPHHLLLTSPPTTNCCIFLYVYSGRGQLPLSLKAKLNQTVLTWEFPCVKCVSFGLSLVLRPIHTKRVYVRRRPPTDVDVRRRTSTSVYADIEHMLKSVRVHTKRIYVRRRT